jgi:archaellum component FlaF (FlaF/FlaG flagellin family)
MSTFDNDDDIEFDFFDEPETVEETQRRRLPRLERPRTGGGPPRPPLGPSPGVTPLLRLVGLVALMIFVVVLLVFWVRSCQGANKQAAYKTYVDHVTQIAQESQRLGQQFASQITTPGTKTAPLVAKIRSYAQQAQSQAADAQNLRPPGPLRTVHSHLVDTLVMRENGLALFADALQQSASLHDASRAASKLAAQGQLLSASDVDWEFFFHDPAVQVLKAQHVTDVNVPHSRFLTTPEVVGTDAMVRLFQQLHGASGSGATGSGPHGDALVSVKVLPAGTQLSTSTPTTVKSSTQLAFVVTVQDSGNSQELGVPVTLSIPGTTILKRQKIDIISPGEQKTVTFKGFNIPAALFGPEQKIKVEVGAVPGEQNLGNNSASYPVFFSV